MAQLKNILNTVWDEAELSSETDRIYALIAPYVSEDPFGTGKTNWASEVAALRDFINGRRAALNNELELDTPPSWDYSLTDTMCDFLINRQWTGIVKMVIHLKKVVSPIFA